MIDVFLSCFSYRSPLLLKRFPFGKNAKENFNIFLRNLPIVLVALGPMAAVEWWCTLVLLVRPIFDDAEKWRRWQATGNGMLPKREVRSAAVLVADLLSSLLHEWRQSYVLSSLLERRTFFRLLLCEGFIYWKLAWATLWGFPPCSTVSYSRCILSSLCDTMKWVHASTNSLTLRPTSFHQYVHWIIFKVALYNLWP